MEAENEKDTARSEFLLKLFLSTEKNKEEMRKHITLMFFIKKLLDRIENFA